MTASRPRHTMEHEQRDRGCMKSSKITSHN